MFIVPVLHFAHTLEVVQAYASVSMPPLLGCIRYRAIVWKLVDSFVIFNLILPNGTPQIQKLFKVNMIEFRSVHFLAEALPAFRPLFVFVLRTVRISYVQYEPIFMESKCLIAFSNETDFPQWMAILNITRYSIQ